ncbi:MAG: hypothetical protein QM768_08635 [Agriterribacter sp.]
MWIVLFFSCNSNSGGKEKSLSDITHDIDSPALKKTAVDDDLNPDTYILHPSGYENISAFFDTAVNGIRLNDCDTIEKLFGDKYELLPDTDDLPAIQIFNEDKSQLLTMYMFNGSSKCDFSQFQVEYIFRNSKYLQTPFKLGIDIFKSGKGIYLKMTTSQLISKLGKPNEIRNERGCKVLSYQEYKGLYFADYYFKNNKLVKFRYGYEYP